VSSIGQRFNRHEMDFYAAVAIEARFEIAAALNRERFYDVRDSLRLVLEHDIGPGESPERRALLRAPARRRTLG